ncbi:HesA/MoeB/ThiF family protein [Streptomyces sp. NBC_01497]|uniref:HesA/MoeB/ThiF family protein n=1 Tax=Streptomyces sp. NBC_01497 TaxID=2903885 RepID=UPI002E3365DA|nr:ThiF family adenylyltransferase [Streptomyces sp. NBC_01497]
MLILFPHLAAATIRQAGTWGYLTLRVSAPDELAVVCALSDGDNPRVPVDPEPAERLLANCDPAPISLWYRVDPALHLAWAHCHARQDTVIPRTAFRDAVRGGYRTFGTPYLAVTYAPGVAEAFPGAALPDLVAWQVTPEGALPLDILIQPAVTGIAQLEPHWPAAHLQKTHALLVGAGSIGSATAHALAGYGIGQLTLMDPDRLSWHNLVRHTSASRYIGRHKVTALAEELTRLRPDTQVQPLPWDVIAQADRVRALLPTVDIVVCTADGVAARRTIGHLARRAGVTAVLACVLQDGAIGEVLRLQPWPRHGCLTCRRQTLVNNGGMDPEPALDAGYGTGTRHRPMTAVGPDLHLVAHLAAKTAVATVLERAGHPDQRLPGEHALLALRRQPDCSPPFDLNRTGELRWLPAPPPEPRCPTCEAP